MKFGNEIKESIYEPWRSYYIAYDVIKIDMKQRQLELGWSENDEQDFEQTLRIEAHKASSFIERKQREIETRISYCERVLMNASKNNRSQEFYTKMDESLTDILVDLNDLTKFTRMNFMAVKKLIKKHDKHTNTDRQDLLVDIMRNEPLDSQRFDVVLVKISTLHDLCMLRGEKRTGNASAGLDQNAFERATAKYWVHPDNIVEVKATILFHLPVLIFNPNKEYEESDSAISSVYMDNINFDLYSGRLQRDDGAEAIRLRWYGPMNTQNIFVERKTHHAPWLDGASVKDRFRLDGNKVGDFLELKYLADNLKADLERANVKPDVVNESHFVASGVQDSIKQKGLQPVMRVFYKRTAFQLPGDQRLRLSLDTDLTFVREDSVDRIERRKLHEWRRADMGIDHPFKNIPPEDIHHFPYAVLETKLQTHLGQEPPEWLTKLLDSNLVYEVPRFSKYLHGAVQFWKQRLPLLPWWLSEIDIDIRHVKEDNGFKGLSRSKSLKPMIGGQYRMGYLERQLENRGQLTRQNSRAGRAPTIRQITKDLPPPPKLADKGTAENPFGDPIWSSPSNNNAIATGYMSRGRGEPFPHAASTECLISDKRSPRSSLTNQPNEKNISQLALLSPSQKEWGKNDTYSKAEEGFFGKRNNNNNNNNNPLMISDKRRKKLEGRIEPKTLLASERTFIRYLHFAMLILSTALLLINFGEDVPRKFGILFFAFAMYVSIWAAGFKIWRDRAIRKNPTMRFDDRYGPVIMCAVLIICLVANMVVVYIHPPDKSTYLGTSA